MAKKDKGFNKPIRNRGEDVGTPRLKKGSYDYMPADQYTDKSQERSIRRHEVRSITQDFYQDEQERDQRAFERLREMRGEFFAGVDPRRRKEIADSGMVQEDHRQMANLPRQAIHCEYPRLSYYKTPYVADLLRGADEEIDDNGNSSARYLNPKNPYSSR